MPYLKLLVMTKKEMKSNLNLGLLIFLFFVFSLDSFSQDNTISNKILLVKRTYLKSWQTEPTQKKFHIEKKVTIKRFSNDTVVRGKIISIMDSSIIIDSKIIPLKDIKRISLIRGETAIGIGAVTTGICLGFFIWGGVQMSNDHLGNMEGVGMVLLSFMAAVCITGPVLIYGVIDRVTEKHYHLDKDFKISVKTVKTKI